MKEKKNKKSILKVGQNKILIVKSPFSGPLDEPMVGNKPTGKKLPNLSVS